MKKILFLSSVLLGAIPASQAGIHFGVGVDLPLPLPPLPRVVISRPAVVYQPAPPVVCAPSVPVVVAAPPVVCAPRGYYYYPYPRGHYYYGHRGFYGRRW